MGEAKHPWAAHIYWLVKDLRDGGGRVPLSEAQRQLLARTLENALDGAFQAGLERGRRRRAGLAAAATASPQPPPLSF